MTDQPNRLIMVAPAPYVTIPVAAAMPRKSPRESPGSRPTD